MIHSILGPIFVLSICIFIHELGHFLSALLCKVKVEKFSIGFGKRLFGLSYKGCEYRIGVIPFGGYVKIKGEHLHETRGAEDEFMSKPVHLRIFITLSGIFMNLLLGWLLFVIVFSLGVPSIPPIVGDIKPGAPADVAGIEKGDRIKKIGETEITEWTDVVKKVMVNPGKTLSFVLVRGTETIERDVKIAKRPEGVGYIGVSYYLLPRIRKPLSGSPAERAGLKEGDLILSIDGKGVRDWNEMREIVRGSAEKECIFEVERDRERLFFKITPEPKQMGTETIGIIGVVILPYEIKRYGPIQSAGKAVYETKEMLYLNLITLYRLITFQLSPKMVAGPIGIVQMASETARAGIRHLLQFTAIISICLIIINLLPIPIADGGLCLFFIAEAIRRKSFSVRFYQRASQIGIAMVILLFVLVTLNDITRLFGTPSAFK